ncbi:MAG: spirocyclase AveC family protein [Acidimicrobiia bacterium]
MAVRTQTGTGTVRRGGARASRPDRTMIPGATQTERRTSPVVYWAIFGAICVAVQLYVYGAWMLSDDFRTVRASDVPDHVKMWAWILQPLFALWALAGITYVVRQCRRERRLTFDAMILMGWVSMIWLDPVPNMIRPQVMFNSYYLNHGSWVEQIPGWISPNGGNLPNPFLVEISAYFGFVLLTVAGCALMRRWAAWRPAAGRIQLFLMAWALYFAVILVLEELIMIRTQWLAWSGVIRGVSLWGGEWYQMPLTEPFFFGAFIAAVACLRYFRDDQGRSVVERGVDRLQIAPRMRTLVSALAIVGFANLGMITYNVFVVPLSLYIDDTPSYPSYMRNGLCGEGTPYDCPGPHVPIILDAGR